MATEKVKELLESHWFVKKFRSEDIITEDNLNEASDDEIVGIYDAKTGKEVVKSERKVGDVIVTYLKDSL